MSLTPEDIENKKFGVVRFREGYNQEEVDDFLDEVLLLVKQKDLEIQDLLSRFNRSKQTEQNVEVEKAVSVLKMAEKAHDQEVEKGQKAADTVLEEASAKAEEIRRQAREEYESSIQAAKDERKKILGDLEVQRENLQRRLDQLGKAQGDIGRRLREAVNILEE